MLFVEWNGATFAIVLSPHDFALNAQGGGYHPYSGTSTMTASDPYANTISGLLRKREEMMEAIAQTREHLAVLSNDLESMDRVLETLGYDGPVKLTARVPRVVLFYRGELRQFLLGHLREHGPSTSRQMAEALVRNEGKDARDRRMMNDVVRRIGKALRQCQDVKLVARTAEKVRGEYVWRALDR